VLRLLLFLWALLLVRERQPDEGRPVDRSFVLDLRRQSWSDLVERDRRRLERERLVRRGEPGDTPGGDDAGGGDAGRRGDRGLDLFHAGGGEHLVLQVLDRLPLEERPSPLPPRLLLLLVVALRLVRLLALDRRGVDSREGEARDPAAARDRLGGALRLALVAVVGLRDRTRLVLPRRREDVRARAGRPAHRAT